MEMPALRFSSSIVFAKVMSENKDLCRRLIERILGFEIEQIEYVETEKEILSIDNRSIQVDAFLKTDGKVISVDMQARDEPFLGRRMRFYRSRTDASTLPKGSDLSDLCDSYVIFICTYDPFGRGLPKYTFTSVCSEDASVGLDNGAIDIVLNVEGDMSLVDPPTARLLNYVKTNRPDDDLTSDISNAIKVAASEKEWAMGVLTFEEWKAHELFLTRREGLAEGRAQGLAEGRAEGRAEGKSEGLAEGRAEGEAAAIDALKKLVDSGMTFEEAVKKLEKH